jgi:hypothetical protein
MLQLPVGKRRGSPSCQLPGLQICEGGDAATMELWVSVHLHQHKQQATGQSVGGPNVNSLPLHNNMLRTLIVAQQFMTEFIGAVLDEEKIVAITKIILNLTKQNDHYTS